MSFGADNCPWPSFASLTQGLNFVMPPTDLPLESERRIWLEGVRLFNEGQYFEAHDAWEEIWSQVRHPLRERFYRAIIQAAVTLELLRRGRAIGVRQVFVSCQELFEGLPEVFMGVRIPALIEQVRDAIRPALEDLETRHVRIDPSRLFAIEMLYDPFKQSLHGEDADGRSAVQ